MSNFKNKPVAFLFSIFECSCFAPQFTDKANS